MKRFKKDNNALIFLFLWVVGLMGLFTAAIGKHEHYILPALPAMCLLMGYLAEDIFFVHRWIPVKFTRLAVVSHPAVIFTCLVATAVGMFFIPPEWKTRAIRVIVLMGIVLVPLFLAVVATWKGRMKITFACLVAAVVLGQTVLSHQFDIWDRWKTLKVFGTQASQAVPADEPITSWKKLSGTIPYYFGRDIPDTHKRLTRLVRIHGRKEGHRRWYDWLQRGESRLWMVARHEHVEELRKLGFIEREDVRTPPNHRQNAVLLYRPARR